MASIGKLTGPTVNFRNYKARVVASFLNLKLDTTPDFKLGIDNKSSEFLAKFPAGKVPVFESADGLSLTDSSAIAYYVASKAGDKSPLLGQTAEETAEVLQYILFAESDLTPAALGTIGPLVGFYPMVGAAQKSASEQLVHLLGVLNNILADKTFLVGERMTVADVVVVCDLIMAFKLYLTEADRKQFRNVTRYFKTMVNQKAFQAVTGPVVLCTERIKLAPSAKKEKKPKAEKKETPKKKEAAPVEEEPKPKPKSKTELLPPTTMPIDNWKRFYSNNDTKPDAMNWLWENLDESGYSFWKVEYKYNDELTRLFMTNNLIGGFFARLERARKYAFGNLLTLGKDDDNMIWGYFMVRGKEIPEEVMDAADFESYEWTAVDHKDAKAKAEIEDCFAWEGPSLPKECYDGKTFK